MLLSSFFALQFQAMRIFFYLTVMVKAKTTPFKCYILSVLVLLLIRIDASLFAQEYIYEAQLLTTDDGLANLMTTAIHQDKEGFVWIATQYGLNRYDGYSFRLYTKEEHGLHSNKWMKAIQEDEEGNLWLYYSDTGTAIDIFDKRTEKAVSIDTYFKTLPFKTEGIIFPRIFDLQKRVWLSTNSGQLYLYEQGEFQKIYERKGTGFHIVTIDGQDNIWLGYQSEVVCINQSGDILEQYKLPGFTCGIWYGEDQTVWLSNGSSIPDKPKINVWQRDNENKELEQFSFSDEKGTLDLISIGQESKLRGETFFHRDYTGFWYVHTRSQSYVIDKGGAKLFHFNTLLDNENIHIPHLRFTESEDYMWWCTPEGVLKTGVKKNPFRLIHQTKWDLSDCRGITEDEFGNIHFINRGIFTWLPKKNALSKSPPIPAMGHALAYQDSVLIFGTYRRNILGSKKDLRTKKFTSFPVLKGREIFSIKSSKLENKFLVGTSAGLEYIDIINDKVLPFKKYVSGNPKDELMQKSTVYHLHQNDSGIWAATSNGVFLFNEEKGILQHFDKSNILPFNHIMHIHEDEEGVFWLATRGGGIIKWQHPNDENSKPIIQQFTKEDGLPINYLYAIYEDDYNRLWIPSDRGIICMDKPSHQVLKTYLVEDGLTHNEFNTCSHYQAKDGTLYFGGLGGLISFHPKTFTGELANESPMAFTGLFVLEKEAKKATDKTQLLNYSEEIEIRPNDKFFELQFALLDFDLPKRHLYAYKIEGYSDNWQYINENYLRITTLPYGNYTIRIKGQNLSKGWSKKELSLRITILKPFYMRGWFLSLFLFAVIGLTVFFIKRRELALKKDKERLEAEVQKRTLTIRKQAEELKELDKAKTRFFSNITHEFRTPLTLIIGPLEQLLERNESRPIRQQLFGVFKNAKQLLTLINQMLDLSKLEGGRMQVEVARGDIVDYTSELLQRFQPLAKKKAQRLFFNCELDSWKTHFDKNKWNKIIYNLVSNAIKFTPDNGFIDVQLSKMKKEENEFIRLIVKDTGIGMEKEALRRIFDRFYQVDASSTRVQGGTGIGLSLVKELVELQGGTISATSEMGIGTTFKIELRAVDAGLPIQDINVSEEEMLLPVFDEPVNVMNQTNATIPQVPLLEEGNEKLTLLLVEDNDEMRAYIRACIDESKYQILEARDGQEGINEALTHVPDLIISDVMMPKKNGFEVVRTVRTNFITSHIPIILLTAKASLESRLTGFKRGADAYLTKPFSPQELTLRIQKLIEIRRMLQARYVGSQGKPPTDNDQFKSEDEFMLKLRKFITKNLDNHNLNVELIGKHFGVSRMALYRKLKALTNQGISDIIRSVRLEVATNLMQEGRLNLSEIAFETGFSSLSHFSRTFKKVYGRSPSDMRDAVN